MNDRPFFEGRHVTRFARWARGKDTFVEMSEIAEEKPAPAAEKEAEPASEKEVINTFQTLRQEASQLFTKINELENEKAEHALGRRHQGPRPQAQVFPTDRRGGGGAYG